MSQQDKDVLVYAVVSGVILTLLLTGTLRVTYSIVRLARGARP